MNFRILSGTNGCVEYWYFEVLNYKALYLNYPYMGSVQHG